MEETKETQAALSLLEDSQGYLRAILLGIALQYRSLDIERCLLLGGSPGGPTPQAVQAAASLITLCALFGFQRQAEGLAAQAAQSGAQPDTMDVKLGAVNILLTLIRLARLQAASGQPGLPAEAETLAALTSTPDL